MFDNKIKDKDFYSQQRAKLSDYYFKVFLVAGGYDEGSGLISSTETLLEGSQAWNGQQPLPSGRSGLRGISLPDTVIMTGSQVITFYMQ